MVGDGSSSSIYHETSSGWWFQPILKNISQIGLFPQVGMKIKMSCHQPVIDCRHTLRPESPESRNGHVVKAEVFTAFGFQTYPSRHVKQLGKSYLEAEPPSQ